MTETDKLTVSLYNDQKSKSLFKPVKQNTAALKLSQEISFNR